ncbi:MAG TPA: hypothetical protein VKW04_09185 [Planctomycetota bacterium]|nr:hypothetical protein [Planctomycetota bacterium]
MNHEQLISRMRQRHEATLKTLDEYYAHAKGEVLSRLCDVGRQSPSLVDDAAIEWASRHLDEYAGAFFALLIQIAARDEGRRKTLLARCKAMLPEHSPAGLGAAGYHLHEHNALLDPEWIELADRLFDRNPDGAWGIVESAAMYRPSVLTPDTVDRFEKRRASIPRDYFVSMLSLAEHWSDRTEDYLGRVLGAFPEHPAEAIDAAAAVAGDSRVLLTTELVEAVLVHFEKNGEKAWDFFQRGVKTRPEFFGDALLDRLTEKGAKEPGTLLFVIRRLMEAFPDRTPELMDRYVERVRRHPEKGIHDTCYDFTREDARLIRPDLVKAVCAGFAANAYPAYEFLWHCVDHRPELIGAPEVEAALANIPHATNRAFGFFRELVKVRPEFTREGTLALFEALSQEPVNRAFVRLEELEGITAVSEAAHIRTGLEKTLREPPRVGSRRARALMAIMFRQKLRARRHVLLEALRYAANIVLWRTIPQAGQAGHEESEKYSPVWDFVMFIIDNAGENAVSTAAAERFLEGAFQLHYLCQTGAEHGEFLRKLDTGYPPVRPFPPGTEFLEGDKDLAYLYRLVLELGRRFGVEPRLQPLKEFAERKAAAERELQVVQESARKSAGTRKRRLDERRHSLSRKLEFWADARYLQAFSDPQAEAGLPEEARSLLRREKKDLAKQLRDVLRAEAIQMAVAAVERSRMDLYRNRLKEALGRDVDMAEVEPKILPAFLWFQAIGRMPNNAKYLRRLIEDRIAHRPHDWLRTEAPALDWAMRVQAEQPGVQLDRWRAPFEKEFQYRPKDALAEKKRRMKADLAQARTLLEKAGAKGVAADTYAALTEALKELTAPPPPPREGETDELPRPAPDPELLQEIGMNLERVRIAEQTPDSDFEGRLLLSVETDPFEILFMGEYGFASCLSLRGSNAWSAVSNAIDIDKAIVWAREPGGNVVGRRLLALTPRGVLTFRTYTNRHGLALDQAFNEFVGAYAQHCGVPVIHEGSTGPLLSDRWYDDGAI